MAITRIDTGTGLSDADLPIVASNPLVAPILLSVVIPSAGLAQATFSLPVNDDGLDYNTDPEMYNCTTQLPLTIVSHTGNGTAQLDYTYTGTVNAGDVVEFAAAGAQIACNPVIYDEFVGTPGVNLTGRTPDQVNNGNTWQDMHFAFTSFIIGVDGDSVDSTASFNGNLINTGKDNPELDIEFRWGANTDEFGGALRSIQTPSADGDLVFFYLSPMGNFTVKTWGGDILYDSGGPVFQSSDYVNGFTVRVIDTDTSVDFFDPLHPTEIVIATWAGIGAEPGKQYVGLIDVTANSIQRIVKSFKAF